MLASGIAHSRIVFAETGAILRTMRWIILMGLLLPLCPAPAATLRMEGDRAWLEAENTPLRQVLRLFEQRGVEVLVDPALELGLVSGDWENTRTDRLVAQLASPNSYLLEWRAIDGPLGAFHQVASIRIFSDGQVAAVQRLSSGGKVFDVVEGAGGVRYIRGEILLGFKAESSQADLAALLAKLGGTVIEVIDPPGLYRIRLNEGLSVEQALETALAQEGVEAAEPNLAFPRLGDQPVAVAGGREGVNLHLQPGETAVAVLDSGLDPQYANLPFIRGTYDALDPFAAISDPTGHGTLTALVASGAITPKGATAAETGVPVLAIRAFDANGVTSSDTIMRALEYAAESGVKIVNMSWGSEVDSRFMKTAMDFAAANGMVLYAAAGNEPTGTPIYPAGYDSVIAVGGLNPDGSRWENSNYGDFVERYEPAKADFNGQSYAGTSISSPYAAFKAALEK